MGRVVSFYRSSVGKKILMAGTGIILVGFLVMHMVGNLKVLYGPEAIDHYAEWLRDPLNPAVPPGWALWGFRIGLLAAVVIHIVAAVQLWSTSSRAREQKYEKHEEASFSYASRTMRWGGIIIGLFVVYHILHFTTGQAHGAFVHGAVYDNFMYAFANPLVWGFYLVAQAALCLHLYHGVWSFFQTLGVSSPKFNHLRRPLAGILAIGLFLGFMLPPTLVLAGVIP